MATPALRVPASCLALCLAAGLAAPGLAQDGEGPAAPRRLEADRFVHDESESTFAAEGNVEFRDETGRVLRASRMVYDQDTGQVVAEGEVSLADTDGTVYRAEAAEISESLRDGALSELVARFPNGATLTAESAVRHEDGSTDFEEVSFTRCRACPDEGEDGERVPWRIIAGSSTHDPEESQIIYRDVVFETFGVPIFYIPYLRSADFSVERKSGFLPPEIRVDDILGVVYEQPYYLTLGPHQDILLRPTWTSREGPVLGGVWRAATASGNLRVEGSVTRGSREAGDRKDTTVRGHADVKAGIGLANGWQAGVDIVRASDRTYLARYGFDRNINVLTQYGFLRKRGGPLRVDLEFYGFQNLSELSEADRVPQVLPRVRVRWNGLALLGGRLDAGLDALVLSQDDGRRNRRVSMETSWRTGATIRGGHVLDAAAIIRGDIYDAERGEYDHVGMTGDPPDVGGSTGRFVPQLEVGWRYPLVRPLFGGSFVLEPMIQALARDGSPNPASIPNTDSTDVQLTHANLFDGNRFPGVDRVEGGVRLNYGVRGTYRSPDGIYARGIVGRVTRLTSSTDFLPRTGLSRKSSDIVGGLSLRVDELGSAYYAFRLASAGKNVRYNQFGLQADVGPVSGDFAYIHLERDPTLPGIEAEQATEQARLDLAWQINDEWRLSGTHLRNFSNIRGEGTLRTGANLEFQDECIRIALAFRKEETRTLDVPPTTTIGIKVELLGF